MARGLPDYFNPDTAVSQRVVDMTSLMTSMVKVSPIDGLGRPVFIETFSEGIYRWGAQGVADGAAPVAYTTTTEIAPAAAYFNCGSLAGGGASSLLTQFYSLQATRIGIEVGVSFPIGTTRFEVTLDFYTADTQYRAQMDLTGTTGVLRINPLGPYVTIETLTNIVSPYLWIPVKMVMNISSGSYERLVVGSKRYDISAYTLDSVPAVSPGRLFLNLQGYAAGAATCDVKVGHVILTLDEP